MIETACAAAPGGPATTSADHALVKLDGSDHRSIADRQRPTARTSPRAAPGPRIARRWPGRPTPDECPGPRLRQAESSCHLTREPRRWCSAAHPLRCRPRGGYHPQPERPIRCSCSVAPPRAVPRRRSCRSRTSRRRRHPAPRRPARPRIRPARTDTRVWTAGARSVGSRWLSRASLEPSGAQASSVRCAVGAQPTCGSPPAASTNHSRFSFQRSPKTSASSRSFSRRSSSSVGSSGARKAIRSPSGAHANPATDSLRTTSGVASPPEASRTYRAWVPRFSRSDRKARRDPSGDHRG